VPSKLLTIEQVLTLLAENPQRIAGLTAGLAPTQLHAASSPGEWSLNNVLAHLRACSDVWGDYIMKIIAEDRPTWRGINPRAWIKKTNYRELEFRPSFRSYSKQRADLLAVLESLPSEGWSRTATVIGMIPGQVFERTALYYADWLAGHERAHVKHIQRIVKTMQT
jgi:hypothetical protein